MGWSDWASGGVEVHVVPGNHANLMYAPHVEVLAAELTACLNQAQVAEGTEWRRRTDRSMTAANGL